MMIVRVCQHPHSFVPSFVRLFVCLFILPFVPALDRCLALSLLVICWFDWLTAQRERARGAAMVFECMLNADND